MSDFDFDVLVVGGGGSAGFTAATSAMKSGARVGMVEEARLGGLCILAGCMPSKTLLHGAAQSRGAAPPVGHAHADLLRRKHDVVEYLAGRRVKEVERKAAQGLSLIHGRAVLVDPHTLEVDGRRITAQAIIIATGSREMIPPLPGLAGAGFLTAQGLMEAPALPTSLIVLGGGAIAVEMAQYAARMGSRVTILQRGPHLLSKEDPQVDLVLAGALEEEGVTVLTGVELEDVTAGAKGKRVRYRRVGSQQSVSAQEILLALGRRPNVDGLGLEQAGIRITPAGAVAVDEYLRASQPGIFAAGDVTGINMVVNLAVVQGQVAGYNATHEQMRPVDDRVMPRAVFTDPQLARVGLNLAEAEKAGLDYAEARLDLNALGVARTYPRPVPGFMSMLAEKKSGRVLGATLVAPEASLMIHDVVVAMALGATVRQLAEMPYIHPSLAEITVAVAEELERKIRKG